MYLIVLNTPLKCCTQFTQYKTILYIICGVKDFNYMFFSVFS